MDCTLVKIIGKDSFFSELFLRKKNEEMYFLRFLINRVWEISLLQEDRDCSPGQQNMLLDLSWSEKRHSNASNASLVDVPGSNPTSVCQGKRHPLLPTTLCSSTLNLRYQEFGKVCNMDKGSTDTAFYPRILSTCHDLLFVATLTRDVHSDFYY